MSVQPHNYVLPYSQEEYYAPQQRGGAGALDTAGVAVVAGGVGYATQHGALQKQKQAKHVIGALGDDLPKIKEALDKDTVAFRTKLEKQVATKNKKFFGLFNGENWKTIFRPAKRLPLTPEQTAAVDKGVLENMDKITSKVADKHKIDKKSMDMIVKNTPEQLQKIADKKTKLIAGLITGGAALVAGAIYAAARGSGSQPTVVEQQYSEVA